MSFGFANAPPHFQWVMNSIFSDMLGKFVLVYLDDIIIYSPDPTSHVTHVRRVLDRLREKQLKLTQCKIGQYQPRSMISKSSSDLPISIGRFVPNYAKTTQPLTALLKKDIKFDWNQATEDSFKALKKAFKDNVILTHA
ncbi:hypothetical protein BASA81_016533 [Batrachochytrium salamandrivorans]|nr:hypothetical protein BASA81_016533 [Batrachochytrium salamandrivorans]